MVDVSGFLVRSHDSIREVIKRVDANTKGIVLVVDESRRLIATVTDGDIRRAVLAGIDINLPVQTLLKHQATFNPVQVTAVEGTSDYRLLRTMKEKTIRHIPLLDEEGRVVDIALLSDLLNIRDLPTTAVVMAGGFGKRLLPLTEKLPKPMLPVADRPLLELIIEQLREAGIRHVNLTTHYMDEAITEHFGDGKDFGVELRYVKEDRPLGTAGGLSLIEATEEPLLVINGDILTSVDFGAMINFHRDHEAEMTVAVRKYEFRVPYGVIETDGVAVTHLSEKPVMHQFINAGIYLLNPQVCRLIPRGQPYDMPDLINRLLREGRRVISFPVFEYWLDIGQLADYEKALVDVDRGEL